LAGGEKNGAHQIRRRHGDLKSKITVLIHELDVRQKLSVRTNGPTVFLWCANGEKNGPLAIMVTSNIEYMLLINGLICIFLSKFNSNEHHWLEFR
jgi:hypothetical protein